MPAFLRPYTFPPLDLAMEPDWERKLLRLAERSAPLPITLVSGVPSWLLTAIVCANSLPRTVKSSG